MTGDGRIKVAATENVWDGKITIGGLTSNVWFTKHGNVYTDCAAENFTKDLGLTWGDLVTVKFLDKELVLPVVPTYSYVDSGMPAIILQQTESGTPTGYVSLAINMGNFAETYGLAHKKTDENGDWYWEAANDVTYPVEVSYTLAEAKGYITEYILQELNRSNNRDDYAQLTDDEFANFRNITTTGIASNRLYRTSSPINPALGRNLYGDAALEKAGVTVIMNLADNKTTAEAYDGFNNTYYSKQNIIYLNLGIDFLSDDFKTGLAKGLRFFAEHKGVYAIHCTEGKDRAGFVSALLECLCGATYEEVVADYMLTYINYYGIEKDSEKYNVIAESNIIKALQSAFDVKDLKTADLSKEAMEYIASIGLTDAEITALKANLCDQESTSPSVENVDIEKSPTTADMNVNLFIILAIIALLCYISITIYHKKHTHR